MPDDNRDIESLLGPTAHLSNDERARVWKRVETGIAAPIPSPYQFILSRSTMIPLVLALMLFVGAGGTVFASDGARPGDLLFPIDRALEDARFALASEDDRLNLRIRFADERLREFESVTNDVLNDNLSGRTLAEAEADIFTNETIVKVEAGDRKAVFATSADTRAEIITAIHDRFGFAEADIDAVLHVETEDRASRADDGAQVSDDDQARIDGALDVLGDYIADLGASEGSTEALSALALIQERLENRSSSLPSDIRFRIRGEDGRFELRGEDGRVRVEIKDGEVRIKKDDDDHDEGFGNDDNSGRGSSDDDSSALEIEADIFTDTTIVKVEIRGQKTTFSTDADTRSEIVDAIESRFPTLSKSEIEAVLRVETEDRASRPEDTQTSDDDDNDDDHSGKGSDDDDNDHSSGSGSGRSGNSGHGGGGDDD